MCGIAGWLDFRRDMRQHAEVIEAMTETLRYRGPDGGGTWIGPHVALGHRRLAVIDPAGGAQPMARPSGVTDAPLVLTYNGEIYNFAELREVLAARGHVFRDRSDTEVLLNAYREWGVACVDHLVGIYAFAIWDAAREELFLARDRMGVKPLYYHPYPGGLVFGSEPKAIMASPVFTARTTEDHLAILFNARMALPGETPLDGLFEVKPGHAVRVDRRGHHEYPYWRMAGHEHTDDAATTAETLRHLLSESVRGQLVADVPLSSMLSGGLDSTAVSAFAQAHLSRSGAEALRTFCVNYVGDEDDFRPTALRPERDAPYAQLAAKHIGADHTEVVLDAHEIIDVLPGVRRARDLPSLGQFDASMYLLFAAMRRDSTVALSAEAADEIFGGYPWHHDPAMVARDRFPWIGDAPRLADCLVDDVHARVRPAEAEADRYATLRAQVPALPGEQGLEARMREVLFFNLSGPLQYLLDRVDRMGMAHGLEVRVPFCDHRLVEYAWNIPWAMKADQGVWKSILRHAVADIVPEETLRRPKSGYPGTHDPVYERHIHTEVTRILRDPASPLHGLLDPAKVDALAHGGGKTMTWLNSAHLLIPVVEIEAWMRNCHVTLA